MSRKDLLGTLQDEDYEVKVSEQSVTFQFKDPLRWLPNYDPAMGPLLHAQLHLKPTNKATIFCFSPKTVWYPMSDTIPDLKFSVSEFKDFPARGKTETFEIRFILMQDMNSGRWPVFGRPMVGRFDLDVSKLPVHLPKPEPESKYRGRKGKKKA